jgi:opacity protein-like surface antigen
MYYPMLRLLLPLAATVGLLAGSARADGSSILTVGVGAGLGIHKTEHAGSRSETAFINQASVRLKLLYFLGADFSYDMSRNDDLVDVDPSALRTQAKMRMTGLLYPYSGDTVGLYLGGGIGASRLGELFAVDQPGNSYHAGAGLEFHLNDHITIDTSFFIVMPGARSIVTSRVAEVEAALATGMADEAERIATNTDVGQYISWKNHEFMVRLFIFL